MYRKIKSDSKNVTSLHSYTGNDMIRYRIHDKKAVFFAETLRGKIRDNIIKIYLFGSRARGDHAEYSDFDFLVVTDIDDNKIKEAIIETEVEFLDKFNYLAGTVNYSKEEWKYAQKFPLGINVLKDGIEL